MFKLEITAVRPWGHETETFEFATEDGLNRAMKAAVDGLASSLGTREPEVCSVAGCGAALALVGGSSATVCGDCIEDGAHVSAYKPKGSR